MAQNLILTVVSAIVSVITTLLVKAWWHQIKSAWSKVAAKERWREVVFRRIFILGAVTQLGLFVLSMLSKAPITRFSIALMIMVGIGIVYDLLMLFIMSLNKQLMSIWKNIDKESDRTDQHLRITKEVTSIMKEIRDNSALSDREQLDIITKLNANTAFVNNGHLEIIAGLNERVKLLEQKLFPPPSTQPPK